MDLNSEGLFVNTSSRWAKAIALVCFAVACGLLISSLANARSPATKFGARVSPPILNAPV